MKDFLEAHKKKSNPTQNSIKINKIFNNKFNQDGERPVH